MTISRGPRALLTIATLVGAVALGRQVLARVNGTVVRDVRRGR